ncbi:yceA [Wigglesworthia glossinidia endosymbiont of Glossina brevipalpis]|uniref:tRNA uridine(34) hydroxylase n=1 Tax=Wigglesworthia glossinidia brevipalpis TaxID=36870 RepID=TRHO_WIGBR|nr:RecName: Full=tRNA uridine(34) hydroxylase; AltName: Full=tRNA hydroxylation protein O [Wigglesworthia glossinidia endosymbiont of Glossina brevipalpis]BAC24211.1 yceA [Wigglesworthia glossinidia endosymbiont of Glossina brevipalpis]
MSCNIIKKISNKRYYSINYKKKTKTISFYKYCKIENIDCIQEKLFEICKKLEILGRIYISYEGINAHISIKKHKIEELKIFIKKTFDYLTDIRFNLYSDNKKQPFKKLKIKKKLNILNCGIKDCSFDIKNTGHKLTANDFNAILMKNDFILVDMRNSYEYEIGHFENALKISSKTFRQQLKLLINNLKFYKSKNIIMYCTGGIRCEAASAWMMHNGFKYVSFLDGGIIEYVNFIKKNNYPMKFLGKIFVFDDRLYEKVTSDVLSLCHQCKIQPCDNYINCKNKKCNSLFIQCIYCNKTLNEFCSNFCNEYYQSKN